MEKRHRIAFTLLELLAVITFLAVAIGITTANGHSLSVSGRLIHAGDMIITAHRLALFEAMHSGKPRRLLFHTNRLELAKPVLEEKNWKWSVSGDIRLPETVRIESVGAKPAEDAAPFPLQLRGITIAPETRFARYYVILHSGCGRRVIVKFGDFTIGDSVQELGVYGK